MKFTNLDDMEGAALTDGTLMPPLHPPRLDIAHHLTLRLEVVGGGVVGEGDARKTSQPTRTGSFHKRGVKTPAQPFSPRQGTGEERVEALTFDC